MADDNTLTAEEKRSIAFMPIDGTNRLVARVVDKSQAEKLTRELQGLSTAPTTITIGKHSFVSVWKDKAHNLTTGGYAVLPGYAELKAAVDKITERDTDRTPGR